MEARLGTRLFHRTGRSVRLTDAGEPPPALRAFIATARKALLAGDGR